MDYKVISDPYSTGVCAKVNEAIADGYAIGGNLFYANGEFHQVVLKEVAEEVVENPEA